MTALERADLHAGIEQRYPDNTTERITPELLRDGLHELVDSVFITASDEGAVPNVPLYETGTTYAQGYTVRYPSGTGGDAFYYSLRAGQLPAPSGSSRDIYWKVVPGPVSTAALSQALTLLEAQALEGKLVVAGRSYLIDFGPDASGNAQLVTLLGTAASLFAIRGQLTVAGVRSNVRVSVASGVFGLEAFDLLTTPNLWLEVNDFSKGIKLPVGSFIDEGGHFYIRQVDVGQKHFLFGPHYSLARDGVIQWKDADFIGQDGNGDVGLARNAPGVLEVNTGTPGYVATLLSKDVVALAAPNNLNSITLLAQAILDTGKLKGANVLWVCGGLSEYAPQRGNPSRPYATLADAQDAAYDGDLLTVMVGGRGVDALGRAYYTDGFIWTKNVRVAFQQGAIYGGIFQLSQYGDTNPNTLFKRQLMGGEFIGRAIAWRHSAGNLEVEVIGARFTGNGNFEVGGGGSYRNDFLTSARLRNCLFDVNITDTSFGAVRLTGRDDQGPVGAILENTRIISVRTPTISFAANAASFVTLQGALTELVGTAPETRPTVPSGFTVLQNDWLTDQRPTSSAYSDVQARAAQLKRGAPAGTTTVTLTAEAPSDYGTIASGSFTIDATSCVVGKCVRFAVAAGGGAPIFANAPSGQPYKMLGTSYASGQAYSYSLLVCVDRIEVVTLND